MLQLVCCLDIGADACFDDVRGKAAPGEGFVPGRELHGHAAERVLALRDGVDGVKLKRVRDGLDDLVDGVEGCVNRPVAQADFFKALFAPLESSS